MGYQRKRRRLRGVENLFLKKFKQDIADKRRNQSDPKN